MSAVIPSERSESKDLHSTIDGIRNGLGSVKLPEAVSYFLIPASSHPRDYCFTESGPFVKAATRCFASATFGCSAGSASFHRSRNVR